MSKKMVFTMKLERELTRQFIQQQRETREYKDFLRNKVETARASMHAGVGVTNDSVENDFAARCAQAAGKL